MGAACLAGLRHFDEWTEVRLPGGTLQIRVEKGSLSTSMRGPASLVFDGEVNLP